MVCNCQEENGTPGGSPTDVAVLNYMARCGEMDLKHVLAKYSRVAFHPSSSGRKRTSAIVDTPKGRLMLLKGSCETVLLGCDTVLELGTGVVKPKDHQMDKLIKDAVETFARNGTRTIALAFKSVSADLDIRTKDDQGVLQAETSGFTMLGIASVKPKLQYGVKDGIALCKTAGIQLKMITGESLISSFSLARECSILNTTQE